MATANEPDRGGGRPSFLPARRGGAPWSGHPSRRHAREEDPHRALVFSLPRSPSPSLNSLSTLCNPTSARRRLQPGGLRSGSSRRSFYTPNVRPRTRPNPMTRQNRGRSCCACAYSGSLASWVRESEKQGSRASGWAWAVARVGKKMEGWADRRENMEMGQADWAQDVIPFFTFSVFFFFFLFQIPNINSILIEFESNF